jgi:hypothetical protein
MESQMPVMDLGELKTPSQLQIGFLQMLTYMIAPESRFERQDIASTVHSATLGIMEGLRSDMVGFGHEVLTETGRRLALTRNEEAAARSEAFEALMHLYASQLYDQSLDEYRELYFRPAGGYLAVARAPGIDRIAKAMERSTAKAQTAASVWFVIMQIQRHHRDIRPDGASVNKAVHVLSCCPYFPDGPRDPSTIKAIWSDYRNVAHLWAGVLFTAAALGQALRGKTPDLSSAISDNLLARLDLVFGATAEIERFALQFKPSAFGEPVISQSDAWLLPNAPVTNQLLPVDVLPLSPAGQEALRNYRAPKPVPTG